MNALVSKSKTIFSTSGRDLLVEEILSFLALPYKWCHGRGGPAKIGAVLNALQILRLLRDLGYERMEVFPDPEGGVLLSAFFGIDSIEVLCRDTQQNYDFVFETPGQDDLVNDGIDQTVVLKNLWEVSCAPRKKSSGYCIHVTTAYKSIDSKVWHSKTLPMASQLSMQNVQNTPAVPYVPMCINITETYQENRLYIGAYNLTNSPLTQGLTTLNQIQGTNAITSSLASPISTIGIGSIAHP